MMSPTWKSTSRSSRLMPHSLSIFMVSTSDLKCLRDDTCPDHKRDRGKIVCWLTFKIGKYYFHHIFQILLWPSKQVKVSNTGMNMKSSIEVIITVYSLSNISSKQQLRNPPTRSTFTGPCGSYGIQEGIKLRMSHELLGICQWNLKNASDTQNAPFS